MDSLVTCNYPGCATRFRHAFDCVSHFEAEHLEEVEQKRLNDFHELENQIRSCEDEDAKEQLFDRLGQFSNQPVKLSVFLKLHAQDPNSAIPVEEKRPLALQFANYRKRPSAANGAPAKRTDRRAEPEKTTTEDERLQCTVEGCRRTYKNFAGLRSHQRSMHNIGAPSTSRFPQNNPPAATSTPSTPQPQAYASPVAPTQQQYGKQNATVRYSYPQYTTEDEQPANGNTSATGAAIGSLATFNASTSRLAANAEDQQQQQSGMPPPTSQATTTYRANSRMTASEENILTRVTGAVHLSDPNIGGTMTASATAAALQRKHPPVIPAPYMPPDTDGKLKCEHCPKTYKSVSTLRKHQHSDHPHLLRQDAQQPHQRPVFNKPMPHRAPTYVTTTGTPVSQMAPPPGPQSGPMPHVVHHGGPSGSGAGPANATYVTIQPTPHSHPPSQAISAHGAAQMEPTDPKTHRAVYPPSSGAGPQRPTAYVQQSPLPGAPIHHSQAGGPTQYYQPSVQYVDQSGQMRQSPHPDSPAPPALDPVPQLTPPASVQQPIGEHMQPPGYATATSQRVRNYGPPYYERYVPQQGASPTGVARRPTKTPHGYATAGTYAYPQTKTGVPAQKVYRQAPSATDYGRVNVVPTQITRMGAPVGHRGGPAGGQQQPAVSGGQMPAGSMSATPQTLSTSFQPRYEHRQSPQLQPNSLSAQLTPLNVGGAGGGGSSATASPPSTSMAVDGIQITKMSAQQYSTAGGGHYRHAVSVRGTGRYDAPMGTRTIHHPSGAYTPHMRLSNNSPGGGQMPPRRVMRVVTSSQPPPNN